MPMIKIWDVSKILSNFFCFRNKFFVGYSARRRDTQDNDILHNNTQRNEL
jgi:hypothetical protein